MPPEANPKATAPLNSPVHPADTPPDTPNIPASIDDIVADVMQPQESAFVTGDVQAITSPHPIGDADQGALPAPGIPASEFQQDIADLEEDISTAKLPDDVQPKSISSFEGLKARYKNKLEGIKQHHKDLETNVSALTSQLQDAQKYKGDADKSLDLLQQLQQVKAELATKTDELNQVSVYRKKYDLENDPHIKTNYTEPMTQLKAKAMDIIKNHGSDEGLFSDILNITSEYELNSLIEQHGFSDLNAKSLKEYTSRYNYLNFELTKAANPEYIDETIQNLRGQSMQASKELAENTFVSLKTEFANHVQEYVESPINKEHNIFVHDKVVAQAENNYNKLVKVLGPEYRNPQVFAALAQSALMAAAYPKVKQMNQYLTELSDSLADQLDDQGSAPPVSQTKETTSTGSTLLDQLENIKKTAEQSTEDIAKEAWDSITTGR